jgi:hypothetical protein
LFRREVLLGFLRARFSAREIDDRRVERGRQSGEGRPQMSQEAALGVPTQTFIVAGVGIIEHLAPQTR